MVLRFLLSVLHTRTSRKLLGVKESMPHVHGPPISQIPGSQKRRTTYPKGLCVQRGRQSWQVMGLSLAACGRAPQT